jgi:hypothetical protein
VQTGLGFGVIFSFGRIFAFIEILGGAISRLVSFPLLRFGAIVAREDDELIEVVFSFPLPFG